MIEIAITVGYYLVTGSSPCGCTHHLWVDGQTGAANFADDATLCAGHQNAMDEWLQAEAEGDLAAELRNERWFEDRGADDGFDEWERSRGVLSFSDAWDASDRAQGLEFSTRTGARIQY